MERKKKPNGLLISGLISALASLALVAVAPGFAGNPPDKTKSESTKDNDGDHDSDPNTALEDDHTTSDDGDNAHPSGKDRSVENGKSGNQGKAESNPDDSKGPMRYEGSPGADKPQGPGGTDTDDQDGNNGCGNDDDFDDDNNGWCGKPNKTEKSPPSKEGDDIVASGNIGCGNDEDRMDDNEDWCGKPDRDTDEVAPIRHCPNGSIMPTDGNCGEGLPCPDGTEMNADGNCDEVLGEQIERDENAAQPDVEVAASEDAPRVLGIRLSPVLNERVKVAGAVLPFTGGDVLMFLAMALALFCSGLVIMKTTRIGRNHG